MAFPPKQGGKKLHKLSILGWDNTSQDFDEDSIARVVTVQKNSYRISDGENEFIAYLSGKFRNEAAGKLDLPTVGDWVEVEKIMDEKKAIIRSVLPRTSQFIRQAAGTKTEAQIVAANLDTILIINSLNHDINIRRIERYIVSTYESGATPVIVLTKKDQCSPEMIEDVILAVEAVAIGIPIVVISSVTGEGIATLWEHLQPGRTAALLGSSGVGKSTLVNTLLEKEVQQAKNIREADSKGRHTTTHREMFLLPNGALIIDTPGMRELQLWQGISELDTTFQDIDALADECRFKDCQHEAEPGCRVQEALTTGDLAKERFQSYLKLQRELAYEQRKQNERLKLAEKQKWKQIAKNQKQNYKSYRKR